MRLHKILVNGDKKVVGFHKNFLHAHKILVSVHPKFVVPDRVLVNLDKVLVSDHRKPMSINQKDIALPATGSSPCRVNVVIRCFTECRRGGVATLVAIVLATVILFAIFKKQTTILILRAQCYL
ncbi:MAG: hypothetical protein NTX03_00570 [Bacteroidetes bacterium]|nr:hypothetical protein [Bacteroidota bacterium]